MVDQMHETRILQKLSQINQELMITQRDLEDVVELIEKGNTEKLSDHEREIWIRLMEDERDRIDQTIKLRQSKG